MPTPPVLGDAGGFDLVDADTGRSFTQPGSQGGRRTIATINGFDLNQMGNRLYITLPKCLAAYVVMARESGTWGTAALKVQIPAPGGLLDFSTPKAIAAGGGYVAISDSEALGLPEICVALTTVEGAAGRATILVQVEEAK